MALTNSTPTESVVDINQTGVGGVALKIDDLGTAGANSSLIEMVEAVATPGISIAGAGRLYFDSPDGVFRVSESAGPYQNITVPVTGKIYIDGDRIDSYTESGSMANPFKTVQAAVNSAVSSPLNYHQLVVSPGVYLEDVNLPATPGDSIAISGTGREDNTTIRSLTIDPQAGPASFNCNIENVRLGDATAAIMAALRILGGGGPGAVFVKCNEIDVFSPVVGINAVEMPLTGGTGQVSLQIETGEIAATTASSAAIVAARGSIWGRFEVTSTDVDAIQLSGTASISINNSNVTCTGIGNLHCISSTGTGSVVASNVALTPLGNGDGINISGVGATASVGNAILIQGAGTGDLINNPLGAAAIGIVSTDLGTYPTVTAGLSVNLAPSDGVGYDNAASGLVATNVKDAIDEVASTGVGYTMQFGGNIGTSSHRAAYGGDYNTVSTNADNEQNKGIVPRAGTITAVAYMKSDINAQNYRVRINGATDTDFTTAVVNSGVEALNITVSAGDVLQIQDNGGANRPYMSTYTFYIE